MTISWQTTSASHLHPRPPLSPTTLPPLSLASHPRARALPASDAIMNFDHLTDMVDPRATELATDFINHPNSRCLVDLLTAR